ncbi:MAG: hypothetical protein LAN62_15750 [Acidobacteriia bacterium]|nr:hypothetical protein [Terriglobia bacterium]
MYKTILVKSLVEEGETLVRTLERQRFPLVAAFWYYDPDRMTWRLFIATRTLDRHGPLHAYKRIQRALAEMGDVSLSLDDISVVSPSGQQFNELRRQVEGIAPASPVRSPKEVVFEDVYVYRWRLDGHHAP